MNTVGGISGAGERERQKALESNIAAVSTLPGG
jgi:hypothetical protein